MDILRELNRWLARSLTPRAPNLRRCGTSSVGIVSVIVEHVCEDVLGVLQSLGHFSVIALKCLV